MASITKIFSGISIFVACIILSACGPVYKTDYTFTAPPSTNGKYCANQCLRDQTACRLNAQALNQQCVKNAEKAARPAYLAYLYEQNKNGEPAIKNVQDFADYSACQSNMGCEEAYKQCFVNCGGQIVANQVCVAFCSKQ